MDLVDLQRSSLADIRSLLTRFVRADIEPSEFIPQYRGLFAPFDPPDLTTGGLTDAERRELEVYIQVMGGWFGEDDDRVPRRADWAYGIDLEPFSWIDAPAYRKWILELANAVGVELVTSGDGRGA